MSTKSIPEGFPTLSTYFALPGADRLIDFLTATFGAEQITRAEHNGVVMNAEIKIGDGMVMIGDSHGRPASHKAMIYTYVPNADETYALALKAGAKSLEEPTDQAYGDRRAAVEDFAGNQWWIATSLKGGMVTKAGGKATSISPYLAVNDAQELMTFLKDGLGAVETDRAEHHGVVVNASLRLGTSKLFVGDNRGTGEAFKTMFYMYVPDTDATYANALKAGAKSIAAPSDQSYGDRRCAIEDQAGNQWWIATRKEAPVAETTPRRESKQK